MRSPYIAIILSLTFVSCGSGNKPSNTNTGDEKQSGDEALFDASAEETVEELAEEDATIISPDDALAFDDSSFEEEVEVSQSDMLLKEEVTGDHSDAFHDSGHAVDSGPQYSDTVQACIYVLEGICDKFLKRCDDMAFGIIPDSWLDKCTQFLQNQHGLFEQTCLSIDNATTNDPTIELIKTMGPLALRACVDNFQCTLDSAKKVYNFLKPIIEGQKPDTSTILQFVTSICFPSS